SRMAFQVRVRVNKNEVKVLSVASSSEEFEQFCVCLGLIFLSDPERLRVVFGQTELEDDQTFESCDIEHLSLLMMVPKMPCEGEGMTL
uniref:Ubiquitin-like domain-containing protein n=1 Tax=Sinocyclocheilus grahami TaxID=75366 RepID=A0A672L7C9_SINGR